MTDPKQPLEDKELEQVAGGQLSAAQAKLAQSATTASELGSSTPLPPAQGDIPKGDHAPC